MNALKGKISRPINKIQNTDNMVNITHINSRNLIYAEIVKENNYS